ncbi:sigma 54-interacting transcriptional regulator [Evansella sp. LMS18]|uniref:sigma-54 interaction domain-containing protein n=1 Tax=Evansella sp. LMS18 TaxID=2924033 RepID=UPI0020D0A7F8|nr:sigma 54-interacting transcriptional regulator [Evansella sp. LMS18]UTR11765.1 sigma 54-interacting transcriptional regulator [Evansella sp. LMS18]
MADKSFFKSTHFQQIFNSINDGIFISDKNGLPLWINDTSIKFIGRPKSELLGINVSELEKLGIINPSVTNQVLKSRKQTSTLQEANGRQYLSTGRLIKIEEDGTEYVLIHARDITEEVRTSEQLERAEALVKQYSREIRRYRAEQASLNSSGKNEYIGKSNLFHSLLEQIEQAAEVDTTVLLTGETGVGKSIFAKKIHQTSERKNRSFVNINCGAIPESLIESELFGYKKGAFTGASSSGKEGLVQKAHKGTLFLDEIGELPIHMQPKLLQLLQNKTYLPVGETKERTADIRIITATNRDLQQMIDENKFRVDLYYRLHILPVNIPPLRERPEDITALLFHYLNKFNCKYNKARTFSSEAVDSLQAYLWPGNIRELENLVERLVITAENDEIRVTDLPKKFVVSNEDTFHSGRKKGESLNEMIERLEKQEISEALKREKTTRKAAKSLGITQSALMRRIKKYNIKMVVQYI